MSEGLSPVTTYDREVLSEAQQHVVDLVGDRRTVLELGANTGYVSRALKARGCTVTATDFDRQALPKLELAADRALWCDLEQLDTLDEIDGERFDVVVLADVLEHLRSPEPALSWAAAHLIESGRVVVSLPNIAHWTIRSSLVRGRFDMAPWGILDRTHLRFFTVKSAEELFSAAGLRIVERRTTTDPVAGLPWDRVLPGRLRSASARLAPRVVARWPQLLSYQIVWSLAAA